jgi:hypothetical protein
MEKLKYCKVATQHIDMEHKKHKLCKVNNSRTIGMPQNNMKGKKQNKQSTI